MAIAKPGTLLNGFSIGGNGLDGDQKLALSALEVKVLKVLMNNNFTTFQRLQATAQNVIDLGNAGLAIYRKANRVVWGKDFNELTGSQKQIGSAKTMNVYIDQIITIDFIIPRNDMKRLKENPNIASQLAAEWNAAIVINKLMELELIHLNAIKQYYIWRYQFDKESVLVLDLSAEAIKDQQSAEDAFYKIGNKMISKITTITKNEVGTNRSDWDGNFEPNIWLNLSRVYTKFIASDVAANTLATGTLYRDQILGTSVSEHYYLGQTFTPGTETAMNKDVRWDLRDIEAFFQHHENEAYPMSFDFMDMVIDNDTRNLRFVGRVMFGLPAFLRPNLGFLIMKEAPTQSQIDYANSVIYQPNNGTGNYEDNLKYAFQLTSEDEALKSLINEDGSLNLKIDIKNTNDYIIGQAMYQLNIAAGEWIIVAKEKPTQSIGDKLTDDDIKQIPSETWTELKTGTLYYMMILKKNADNDFTYERLQEAKIINVSGSLG